MSSKKSPAAGANIEAGRRSSLGQVFLIVFLDIVGFSILFPLFPSLLEYYVGLEGDGSSIGRLAAQLERWTDGNPTAVHALFGGVLGTLYSTLQFAFAPIWGALSDRIGRRPTLLVTLVGTVAGYVLWVFAGSFALLIASRLVCGIAAGNISTASAVVADTTTAVDRAKGMAILGVGIGLGFVVGPALGGMFVAFDLLADNPDWARFGLNPFSVPALLSLALALLNLVWVAARLPETLPAERRRTSLRERSANPFRALRSLTFPGVPRTNAIYLIYLTAFSAIEFTLVFLAVERFAFEPRDNAWMFVFVGLVIAFVQGGLVRRLAPRLGERRLARFGLAMTIPGFVLLALAQSVGTLYAGLFCMAFGSAFAMPSLSALVSRYSPAERQGLALGTFRSMGSLARAIGPLLGGLLYWRLGSAAPYYLGTALLVVPIVLAAGLPALPAGEGPAEAPAG